MQMKILDIGQCGFDGPAMSQLFQEKLHAKVDNAPNADEAKRHLADRKYNLALVNRLLAADGSSGIELIDMLVKSGCTTPLMLVSDLPEAQDAAVSHGALRGFGKSDLEDPQTLELIRSAAR
jgi:DNA-binding response OmpR family regulator